MGFDDIECQEPETLSITLNSLTRVVGISSIRLIGKINGREVSFLVDSKATHNFVAPLTAKRIGLQLKEVDNYKVEVADGEKVEGGQCSNGVKVVIRGITTTDLLILPLGDSRVILVTVWPQSLGPSLWDFNKRTLKFWRKGKPITLQGIQSGKIDVVEGNVWKKLFQIKRLAYAPKCQEVESNSSVSV